MTYSTKELEQQGFVEPECLAMRRWRRERGLTIRSMATMLGTTAGILGDYELGRRTNARLASDYLAFMQRWERVPEVQRKLDELVHRQKLNYSLAAHARNERLKKPITRDELEADARKVSQTDANAEFQELVDSYAVE